MISAFLMAVFFFLAVPGIGAFIVRRRWRVFRRLVASSARWPILSYGLARGEGDGAGSAPFRMYGKLQALEGDQRIWLNDGATTAGVDLDRVSIFVLPSGGIRTSELPDATPREYAWHELSAIPEGTSFFVAGLAKRTAGGVVFSSSRTHPLLVILYECPEEEVYARAIWTGRQRNEYWNAVTLPSLGAGFLAQLTLAIVRLPLDRPVAFVGLVLAVLPFLPLVPPGNVGFLVYRRLWRYARRHRSERDVVRLPLAYRFRPLWPGIDVATTPAGGRFYHVRRWEPRGTAGYAFGRPRGALVSRTSGGTYHLFVRGRSAQDDPMPPQIVSDGAPRLCARRLTTRARFYETASVVAFTVGLGANVVLLFAILRVFVL